MTGETVYVVSLVNDTDVSVHVFSEKKVAVDFGQDHAEDWRYKKRSVSDCIAFWEDSKGHENYTRFIQVEEKTVDENAK